MQDTRQTTATQPFERFLAILGVVVCLMVTVPIWWSISAEQTMWLLPGIYFVEMVVLSIVSAFLFIRGNPHDKNLIGARLVYSVAFRSWVHSR